MCYKSTHRSVSFATISLIASVILLCIPGRVFGQEKRPGYHLLRQEEDWSFLENTPDKDYMDLIKYIPLSEGSQTYVSLGGKVRYYFKFHNHGQSIAIDSHDEYLWQRIMVHGAIISRIAQNKIKLRGFFQLKSGLVAGRNGPISPVNKDKLDIHQAFVEISYLPDERETLMLRAGRQELTYGAGRMMAVREGPNVRFGYDALLARYKTGNWTIDAFVALPMRPRPGFFDNDHIPGRTLWGAYVTGRHIEFYYLGFDRSTSFAAPQPVSELRHTIGTRLHASSSRLSYGAEIAFQFGRFENTGTPVNDGSVRAWGFGMHMFYSFPKVSSAVGVNINIGSGDSDRSNSKLGTFEPPYPTGRFKGEGNDMGPSNLINFQPYVRFSPYEPLSFSFSSYFFWRQQTEDHLYYMSGRPYQEQVTSRKKYIGTMPEMVVEWTASRHISAALEAEYLFVGPFLESIDRQNMAYIGLKLGYTF